MINQRSADKSSKCWRALLASNNSPLNNRWVPSKMKTITLKAAITTTFTTTMMMMKPKQQNHSHWEGTPKSTEQQASHQRATRISRANEASNVGPIVGERNERLNKRERQTMNPLIFVVLLWATIQQQMVHCDRSQQEQPSTDSRNSTANGGGGGQQVNELLAIGAISLLEPVNNRLAPTNGRLVDRISSTTNNTTAKNNKLDYIIEFMQANKLTKFCDLLNSKEPAIRTFSEKLNSLGQFTLFVPTDEAILLMPIGQLEQIKARKEEMKQFLLAHATSELVVPKLNLDESSQPSMISRWPLGHHNQQQQQQVVSSSSTSLVFSLAGSPLRVTTAALQQPQDESSNGGQLVAADARTTTKLVLIVNGANVINGHSYALQEPNNSNLTYAIVHLVDRALYPVSSTNLMERVRSLAPRMTKYIELANDLKLNEALESTQKLSTLFVPTDDAFKATPAKLLDQLDNNRTFLVHFLRGHLIGDDLYYSGQLAFDGAERSTKLSSFSGSELEFESKRLQSRTLVLVNSIPILEPDIITLNGVVHLITRPIFERHLLDACQCGNQKTNTSVNLIPDNSMHEKLWLGAQHPGGEVSARPRQNLTREPGSQPTNITPNSNNNNNNNNRFQQAGRSRTEISESGGNELEREESQHRGQSAISSDSQRHLRSQRSNHLVARNNRDFYRPSAAPANLLLDDNNNKQDQEPKRQDANTEGQIFINRNDFIKLASDAAVANESRTSARLKEGPASNTLGAHSKHLLESAESGNLPTSWHKTTGGQMFEVERYKVILNATSRQRIREEQRDHAPASSSSQFVYDRPLITTARNKALNGIATTESSDNKRLYSAINSSTPSLNTSGWMNNDQLAVVSTNRQLRLLKFQPEDGRDPLPGTRIPQNQINVTMMRQASSQPAYDVFDSLSTSNNNNRASAVVKQAQQQFIGKTVPPTGFGGCAFYDTDCKRLVGRLVRLPSSTARNQQLAQKSPSLHPVGAYNQTHHIEQHLDSTFGETTENPLDRPSARPLQQPVPRVNTQTIQLLEQKSPVSTLDSKQQTFTRLNSPRVSPLNQPLPPWSDEEHRGAGQPHWRTQEGDISRITSSILNTKQQDPNQAHGFANGLGREAYKINSVRLVDSNSAKNQQMTTPTRQSSAQIVLVPVKVLQEIGPGFTNQPNTTAGYQHQQQQQGQLLQSSQRVSTPAPSSIGNFNNQQYHTPTPYSVSLVTTHLPTMFNRSQQLSRLTNFTAIETLPFDESMTSNNQTAQKAKSLHVSGDLRQIPRAPSAFRKQRLQQQQQHIHHQQTPTQIDINTDAFFSPSFLLNPTTANDEKQSRKIVRFQAKPPSGTSPAVDNFNSDISITSARLSSGAQPSTNFTLAGGLATQASNQAPNVSANFVRSAPVDSETGDQSAEFFQNRTIAEIMDDSGLKIDGQQVTFSRLKQCLTEAELLNLVTQTGNSITIFMPTDSAFQRLVQQQAVAHQRERQLSTSSGSRSISSRLLDPSRRYLVPLVARRWPPTERDVPVTNRVMQDGASSQLLEFSVGSGDSSAISAITDRLSLDCSSSQVRQILLDHLSARLITPKQLQADIGISSLSGRKLLLSSVPSKKIVVVDGQPVIAATRAKNGMVYVVNKFLNLTQQVPNVINLIETQPNLTTFLSYLSFSSLADRLKRETGPLTILAPTNDAFDQLSSSARQLINSDPSALMDLLRGHIVEGAQFGKLISMRNRLKTMNSDQTIEAKVIKPNLYLLDNQMTSMRLVGTTGNGVVNAIDRLIVPSWLKVSMGSKPAVGILGSESNRADRDGSDLPQFAGELDTSTGVRNPNNQMLNLPVISSKPVRFEQPGNRLTTSSGSNSFLFANGNSNPINNNLLDFDIPIDRESRTTTSDSSILSQVSRSPFLQVATNLTNSAPFTNDKNKIINDTQQSPSLAFSNVTSKNMHLIEKLANLMQAKKFIKYLIRSRLSEVLKPDMNYVILVPTDQAIEKLPKQITDMLERDPERLADLVNYHVLDTTFEYINTIPDGQTLNTLNEKDILFNWHRNNTILTASGAVVMGGIQEENIALLIVDRVLYPTPGDILNIISKSPILSNLTSLVRNAGLEQQLSLAGPYTLFAPSDFAFNQLDKRDLEFLQRNKETARRFLLRHLSQPAIFTSTIALSNNSHSLQAQTQDSSIASLRQQQVPTMTISNSLGEDLTLRQRNDYFSINDVNFSYADVAATNGVVHVIDGLL